MDAGYDPREALSDDLRLREEDWLSWCRMDRPEDLTAVRAWDIVARIEEGFDRVQRIMDGDPELS